MSGRPWLAGVSCTFIVALLIASHSAAGGPGAGDAVAHDPGGGRPAPGDVTIGERPAVERHLDQADIDSGAIGLAGLIRQGRVLFDAVFNGRTSRIRRFTPCLMTSCSPGCGHRPTW